MAYEMRLEAVSDFIDEEIAERLCEIGNYWKKRLAEEKDSEKISLIKEFLKSLWEDVSQM